jgi:UDP-N-acetylmuramate: L-alanyl-gamma-D-glutamyl-meso-diaminopimelate ligase
MAKKHYHFTGICGTAMASLAVLLKNRGHQITGSDENVYPPMSDFLQDNGIEIQSPYGVENLKPHPDYVVLGNALSRGNLEVEYALEKHLHYLSMAELLKNDFIRNNRSIVISGTHGKTTTTSLAAHVLHQCQKPTGFMVGGIAENFKASSKDIKDGYFVIEGDEYDTSFFDKRSKFFHYLPDILIINNIEFDHADIFKNLDEIKRSFSLMLRQIPQNGLIIVNGDDPVALEVANSGFSPVIAFGKQKNNDAIISNFETKTDGNCSVFTLEYQNRSFPLKIPLMGEFNAYNATAVSLMALNEGLTIEEIQKSLLTFKNVRRRLQLVSTSEKNMVFDDFAHHPTAIQATIGAVRKKWPNHRIHAVFEARSNTSVRKFHQDRMAQVFSEADHVIFYKLHREAKIAPEDRLDLDQVVLQLRNMKKKAHLIKDLDDIVDHVVKCVTPGDIVLVMSQGAFGGIQHKIAQRLDT